MDRGPDPPLHGQFGQCRECLPKVHSFQKVRREQRANYPFRVARRLTPRRCSSSGASHSRVRRQYRLHGKLIQFPVQFQWDQSTPSVHGAQNAQERRTLERTRTQNQNRIIISARIHRPVAPIPSQSLGYDTRGTGEQTARSPTSWAIGQCRVFAEGSPISVKQDVNRSERRFTIHL